jgi:protein gp37
MAEVTTISWADATFNPVIGCSKVSPGCSSCYAKKDFDDRRHVAQWGDNGTRVVTSKQNWRNPTRWNSKAREQGIRTRVFCASLSDVFENWQGPIRTHDVGRLFINPDGDWMTTEFVATRVPFGSRFATMNDVRQRLFKLIDKTPHLDWMLLTKRPENILKMWPDDKRRENVWLGTSVENQEYADKRIPELLNCRHLSPVLFLSCEPLLGPIEFSNVTNRSDAIRQLGKPALDGISWVIVGGESGFNARPSNAAWFRSIRDQCKAVGVPFHFKQFGEFDQYGVKVGKAAAGNMLDGRLHQEFPKGIEL